MGDVRREMGDHTASGIVTNSIRHPSIESTTALNGQIPNKYLLLVGAFWDDVSFNNLNDGLGLVDGSSTNFTAFSIWSFKYL